MPKLDGETKTTSRSANINYGNQSTKSTDTQTESHRSTSESGHESIAVVNGTLPVDPVTVFADVQELLGTNVKPPEKIVLETAQETSELSTGDFYSLLTGIQSAKIPTEPPGGKVRSPDVVYISPGNGTREEITKVLVHEFVHVIQFRQNVLRGDIPERIKASLLQGAAIYVTDSYVETYLPGVEKQSEEFIKRYHDSTPEQRYWLAQNYFGYKYFADTINTPRDVATVYQNPPITTEQLIYGLTPTEEQPEPLSIKFDQSPSGWTVTGRGRMGELFTRLVLETGTSRSRAVSGAAGWENDRRITYWDGDQDSYSYIWVTLWDTSSDATEFTKAMNALVTTRESGRDNQRATEPVDFSLRQTDNRRVSIIVGSPRFVSNVRL